MYRYRCMCIYIYMCILYRYIYMCVYIYIHILRKRESQSESSSYYSGSKYWNWKQDGYVREWGMLQNSLFHGNMIRFFRQIHIERLELCWWNSSFLIVRADMGNVHVWAENVGKSPKKKITCVCVCPCTCIYIYIHIHTYIYIVS